MENFVGNATNDQPAYVVDVFQISWIDEMRVFHQRIGQTYAAVVLFFAAILCVQHVSGFAYTDNKMKKKIEIKKFNKLINYKKKIVPYSYKIMCCKHTKISK